PSITRRLLFLQGALLFSVLSLQTGVIRSDWEHVTLGLFTIISLTAAILIGSTNESAGRARSYVPGYLALALTAIFTGPLPLLNSSTLLMAEDRKSTRLNSSHVAISYAVFCLKKKKITHPVADRERTYQIHDTEP